MTGKYRERPHLAHFMKGCRRKIRYKHIQTAENAVRALEAKGDPTIERYLCRFCDGWHVGHRQESVC